MERDQENEKISEQVDRKRFGRSWTERFTGQVRYRRFTHVDGGGRPSILFKFELAPGQADLPQEVYDVLHELKYLERSPGHGRRPHRTGLEFTRDTKHGRVWRLNNDATGRLAADLIDAKLRTLVTQLEREPGAGR